MRGYNASGAMAWLLANTPEDWCWTFGFHPNGAARGRGDAQRLISLTLLLPEVEGQVGLMGRNPRIYEEARTSPKASYLTLAKRAVARAKPPPDAPVVVPAAKPCRLCGAAPDIACARSDCDGVAQAREIQAKLRQTLQRRAAGQLG
jgi:hypothetical protein